MECNSIIRQLILISLFSFSGVRVLNAQTICNPNGNIFIVSNYDGGILNLVVDQNIPNLKIGVVSYEAIEINLSGPFLANVTEVRYAGYNSSPSNNCGPNINTTAINGAPVAAQISITNSPPVTNPNPNGSNDISCLYDCDTTVSQGGCNTADEVVDYFLQVFQGGSIYAHRTQYNCYSGNVLLSAAGNCCTFVPPSVTLNVTINQASCFGICDGEATVAVQGGTPPYSVVWSTGDTTLTVDSLCAGIYNVNITDSNGISVGQSVSVIAPNALNGTFSVTPDNGSCNGQIIFNPAGGNGSPFTFAWDSCGNAAGAVTSGVDSLCAGTCCVFVTDVAGCRDTFCVQVPTTVGIDDVSGNAPILVSPNPSSDGIFYLTGKNLSDIRVRDLSGRAIPFEILSVGSDTLSLHINGKGLFLLELQSESRMQTIRLVVTE